MTAMTSETGPCEAGSIDHDRLKGALRAALGIALMAATLFVSAGSLEWNEGWLYVLLVALGSATTRAVVARYNPELLSRRAHLGPGTKWWDKVFLALYVPIILSMVVVAGIDAVRLGWSSMSPWLGLAGLATFGAAIALSTWAMVVNTHFESSVRIQSDRQHRVIDAGPYRLLRHPGYAASILYAIATPLILGSWWAFVPAFVLIDWNLLRTALEDSTLQRELPGYAAYAQRVRSRLIPGVW